MATQEELEAENARLRADLEAAQAGKAKAAPDTFKDKVFSPGSATDPRATPGVHTAENPNAPATNPPAREVWPGGAGTYEQKVAAGVQAEA